ncbi:hypothetical protein [Candidatus Poriferisodalis sp.]|uniref:hypothetical protein n=1 Tax=Candidatus Poriferisodalis sp. TaxID=3101277 RepID=UPI003B027FE8
MITPLGREMRSLGRQIADKSSQMGDLERVRALQRELERKLQEAGATNKEIAKAAGVSRWTVRIWIGMADRSGIGRPWWM